MAIAYVNAGTRTQTSGNTNLTPTLPASRVNGNFLTAMRMSKDGSTHTCADATWTKIAESKSGTSQSVSIWFRLVDGTEAAPTIVSGNSPGSAIIYQRSRPNFNNSNIADMVGAISANSGSGATHTSTGIVTTRDNSFVAYFDCGNANTALATPSGWTENSDQGNSTGASRSTTGSKTVATAGGNSGDISVTGATGAWNQIQIEFLDAAIPAGAYRITDTADDRYSSDSALGSDVTSIIVGDIGSLHKAGVRFLAVDAEQGATVVSAVLYHKQLDVYDPVGAPKVHAVPGPCAAWTTTSPSAATLTTASADLSYASGVSDAWMETDVTALVQEAINDGSWTTGSALGLVLSDPTAPSGGAIEIYDYLSGAANGAGLYLEVETGGGVEEFVSASLSGSGSAAASAKVSARSSVSVSGSGQATVSAGRVTYAAASLSASGTMQAQAGKYTAASVNLSASGSASTAARASRTAAAGLSGSAIASASIRAERFSSAEFAAEGAIEAAAGRTTKATASFAGAGSASVIARRITRAGLSSEGQGSASARAIVAKAASASMAGTGILSISTRARLNASASLVGEGSITASAQGGGASSVSMSGAGTLSAAVRVERRSEALLSAAGGAQTIGRRLTPASASLTAEGTLSATIGADNEAVAVSLAGSGTLTASCRVERRAAAVLTGAGAMTVLARIEERSSAALSGAGILTARAIIPSGLPPSEARNITTAIASRNANSNEPARDISTTRASRNQVTAVRSRDAQSVRFAR